MWHQEASKNTIIIIDISGHTPKRKQVLIQEEPQELDSLGKVIIFGSIIPLLITILVLFKII